MYCLNLKGYVYTRTAWRRRRTEKAYFCKVEQMEWKCKISTVFCFLYLFCFPGFRASTIVARPRERLVYTKSEDTYSCTRRQSGKTQRNVAGCGKPPSAFIRSSSAYIITCVKHGSLCLHKGEKANAIVAKFRYLMTSGEGAGQPTESIYFIFLLKYMNRISQNRSQNINAFNSNTRNIFPSSFDVILLTR